MFMWFIVGSLAYVGDSNISIHEVELQRHRHRPVVSDELVPRSVTKSGRRVAHSDWQVHGYYPYWANRDSEIPWDSLSHLIYFSLELNADGSIDETHQWLTRGQALVEEGHRHGVRVLPCVTMFDDEAIRTFLASSAARASAISALLEFVREAGADGVNLDFEFVPSSNGETPSPKENFVTFVQDLKAALASEDPAYELSLATPAVDWSGTYDYDALAEASDGLLIMGYGYHWSGGAPGPIAPIESGGTWSSRSLTWTLDDYDQYGLVENRSKFILGLPLYGRQWPTVDDEVPGVERAPGVAVSMEFCDDRFLIEKRWDEDSSTPYRVFQESDGWEQLFCEDLESLNAKYELIQNRNIGGLMLWDVSKIPGDHPAWPELRSSFGALPVDPSDQSDPTEQSDPTDPSEGSDPSDTSEPSDPGSSDDNIAPVVVISAPEAVEVGAVFRLDAQQSTDPDGDALSFEWSQKAGPAVEWIQGQRAAEAELRIVTAGPHEFRVVVSDGTSVAEAVIEVLGLESPSAPSSSESGCSQSNPSLLLLFLCLQFATWRRRTYNNEEVTTQ